MADTPTNLPANEEVVKYLPKLQEWGVSVIRTTIVPPLAALLVLWIAAKAGFEVDADDPALRTFVFTAVTGVWYSLMRGIEVLARKPWVVKIAGWLLGVAKAPASRVTPTP